MNKITSSFPVSRFILLVSLLGAVALATSASAQNLATRRLIDDAKKNQVPPCEAIINEKAGVAIPVEVDFASLGDNPTHFLSLKDLLQGVSDGITAVTKDSAGKEAVAAKVKKIVLIRDEKGYGADFKDGVLTLKASFVSNFASSLAEKVEAKLGEVL